MQWSKRAAARAALALISIAVALPASAASPAASDSDLRARRGRPKRGFETRREQRGANGAKTQDRRETRPAATVPASTATLT